MSFGAQSDYPQSDLPDELTGAFSTSAEIVGTFDIVVSDGYMEFLDRLLNEQTQMVVAVETDYVELTDIP